MVQKSLFFPKIIQGFIVKFSEKSNASDCNAVSINENGQYFENYDVSFFYRINEIKVKFQIKGLMELKPSGEVCRKSERLELTVSNPAVMDPDVNKIVSLELEIQHFPTAQAESAEKILVPIDYEKYSTSFTKILDPLFRNFWLHYSY